MPRLIIEGGTPYDGSYELDLDMTVREWHTIKQMSGVLPGTFEQAVRDNDLDLAVALAVNTLRRAGHQVNVDALLDTKAGSISVAADEDDAVPPPTPSDEPASSVSVNPASSGGSSTPGGVGSDAAPSPTGSPGSVSSA